MAIKPNNQTSDRDELQGKAADGQSASTCRASSPILAVPVQAQHREPCVVPDHKAEYVDRDDDVVRRSEMPPRAIQKKTPRRN